MFSDGCDDSAILVIVATTIAEIDLGSILSIEAIQSDGCDHKETTLQ